MTPEREGVRYTVSMSAADAPPMGGLLTERERENFIANGLLANTRIAELEHEVERLRAALERIAALPPHTQRGIQYTLLAAVDIAREALEHCT